MTGRSAGADPASRVGAIISDNDITQTGFEADGIFLNIENVVMDQNTISTGGDNANGAFAFAITRDTQITNSSTTTSGDGARPGTVPDPA